MNAKAALRRTTRTTVLRPVFPGLWGHDPLGQMGLAWNRLGLRRGTGVAEFARIWQGIRNVLTKYGQILANSATKYGQILANSATSQGDENECKMTTLPFRFQAIVVSSGFFAILCLGTPTVAPLLATDLGTSNAIQWSPFVEWTLDNPTWDGNPFDLDAVVEFKHEASGEKRRTEMFFAKEKKWAFRFTGTRLGEWTFTTKSADKELHGHTGRVIVQANKNASTHGFLKKFGDKWGWEGSENVFVPQLVMWDYIAGDNSPRTFHHNPKLIDAKLGEFLDGHGFTGVHVSVVGGRWFDMDAESDRVARDMTEPDPRTFDALELLITRTHQVGGVVHIWPWGDHARSQTPKSLNGGIGGEIDRRLQRYIAARLGPIPGWSMGYGFDLDEWVSAGQVRQWRDSMHAHLGWHHFLSGRPVGPNRGADHRKDASWNEGLDYSSYEHHQPTYQVYRAAFEARPDYPVMSEDRFRVRKGVYPDKDYSEELTRRGLYHSTLAGGAANIWGVHPSQSRDGVYSNRDQIKTYSVFFHDKQRFLVDMTPANQLSDDPKTLVLRSSATNSLVLYREQAKTVQIDLSTLSGPAPAIAVDTKQRYKEIKLGRLDSKRHTLRLPAESDWVVAIGDFVVPVSAKKSPAEREPEFSFSEFWVGPRLKGGHGAMWADVDGDQLPDLYLPLIIDGTLPDLFLHNKGQGKFVEEGAARGIADPDGGSHGATWCDLDNDGDFDLINGTTFSDGTGIQNDVFRNDGSGHFVELKPAQIESRREATRAFLSFDMDGDGDLDLFGVTNYQGTADPPEERNEIYLNDGDFVFRAVTSGDLYSAPAGQGATDSDFDGDGDIDILAANRTGPVNILRNDGKGSFSLVPPASIGIRHQAKDGVTTADVDNDGDIDMLLAGNGGSANLYLNSGGGMYEHGQSFDDAEGYMGGFADLDNDGDVDLYFAGDSHVQLNDGSGHFSRGASLSTEGVNDPRGVAFADFDRDGDLDFAFGTKRAPRNFIIRNGLRKGGHWLKVRLITADGQAGAFGAKTMIYRDGQAGGELLGMRESQSNSGYLGQNDPVLHFGLGTQVRVDVVVRFLDGTTSTRQGVKANQTITVVGIPR